MDMPDGLDSRVNRLETNLERLSDLVLSLASRQEQLDNALATLADSHIQLVEAQKQTAGAQKHTDETLGALIHMMDEWIRRNPM
jgi:peptidoglycan hydrolase CwlO-like protein